MTYASGKAPDYLARVGEMVDSATDSCWRLWRTAPFARLTLYFQPGATGGKWGGLAVTYAGGSVPPACQLATAESISPAWPRERVRQFIADASRRLPLLPPDL